MAKKNTVNYNIKLDASVTSSVKKLQKTVDSIHDDVSNINKTKIEPKVSSKTTRSFKGLGDVAGNLKSQFTELISKTPLVGGQLASLTASLGPLGMAIGAVVGATVGLGLHLTGVAKELATVRKEFQGFIQDSDELRKITVRAKALQSTFENLDMREIADAQKVVMKEFGITSKEAFDLLEKSMIATNGRIDLDNIKEYATQIKSIGGDADRLLSVITLSNQEGLYLDKGVDTLKEFNLRITEMPKAAKDALKSVGVDALKLQKKINSGVVTQEQVFRDLFSDLNKYSKSQRQTLIADLLGGPGEDLGQRGIELIAKFNGSLDDLVKKSGKAGQKNQKLISANNKLVEAQEKAVSRIAPLLNKSKLAFIELRTQFYEFSKPIVDFFLDLEKDIGFRLKDSFKNLVSEIKLIFQIIGMLAKTVAFIAKLFLKVETALKKIKDFIANKLSEVFNKIKVDIKNALGDENVAKLKKVWGGFIEFLAKKWMQLSDMLKANFEGINQGLAGNFKESAKQFAKALQSGRYLLGLDTQLGASRSTLPTLPGGTPTTDTTTDTTTASTNLDRKIGNNISNAVSGASADVNNVTLNLDALQKIETQNINNSGDVDDVAFNLQRALLQVANDINSTVKN